MKIKLWKISQEANNTYNTYDSAVVVAENEDQAKKIHPSPHHLVSTEWWITKPNLGKYIYNSALETWAHPDKITVEYLGETERDFPAGTVIIASFNAG